MLAMNLARITDSAIEYSFYLLFFLVPLVWLPSNFELFEFNKMILTYILTTIISAAWITKILAERKYKFRTTPLDLPILAFLAANIVTTIFSFDIHTSIFGYYSRFHGGLLSTISYSLLYFALVNNFDKRKLEMLLVVGLVSGFLVSAYAILQHPNPLFRETTNGKTVFHGIDYQYWAEAVERRVFSTLGQPNWLAAYLAMLLPLGLYFMLASKRVWQKSFFLLSSIASFLAFTFTYSRGGSLGLIAAALVFILGLLVYRKSLSQRLRRLFHLKVGWPAILEKGWIWLGVFAVSVVIIFAQFGNALELRGVNLELGGAASQESGQTQLEVGGIQTTQTRLIVWNGALEIFKHYPVFGTGVETFGFSYYLFRPTEHNLTSEWDFLFNKAHNEYLNYLSTQGVLGFLTYILLISFFLVWSINYLLKKEMTHERLLVSALLAGYVSYLVQNFFGFSIVTIAIFFYLFPAIAFVVTGTTKEVDFPASLKRRLSKKELGRAVQIVSVAAAGILLVIIARIWLADTYYASGFTTDTSYNYSKLKTAVNLFPFEPTFKAELANQTALLATEVDNEDLQKRLSAEAVGLSKELEQSHPKHTAAARQIVQTYYALSQLDDKYLEDLVASAEKLAKMAPTDATIQYNLAVSYWLANRDEEALKQVKKVLELKPDYEDAKLLKEELEKPSDV